MSQISVQSWQAAIDAIEKEKKIARMIESWNSIEEIPVPISLTFDWGYRAFVNPPTDTADEDLHRLLAWFVRRSGKRFTRNMRDDGSIFWWNMSQNPRFEFEGESLDALIFLERFKAGKCRIVEETKTVTVKKLVCDEPAAT